MKLISEKIQFKDTVAMMNSGDYSERFVAEYIQTKIRYEKLHDLIVKYDAGNIGFEPSCTIDLLKSQKAAMGQYLYWLEVRAEVEDVDLSDAVLHLMSRKTKEKSKTKTLEKAIDAYGKDLQLTVAIEEFSELIKEICKNKRGKDNRDSIIEEMADCYIMLEQLAVIFGVEESEMKVWVDAKLARLESQLVERSE